jgi:hypothetical protein
VAKLVHEHEHADEEGEVDEIQMGLGWLVARLARGVYIAAADSRASLWYARHTLVRGLP